MSDTRLVLVHGRSQQNKDSIALKAEWVDARQTLPGEFRPNPTDPNADPENFGKLHREGRDLYRYRTKEYRIYFERTAAGLFIHRVLHKNTLKDFLFRTKMPMAEDEILQKVPEFWEFIDGRR